MTDPHLGTCTTVTRDGKRYKVALVRESIAGRATEGDAVLLQRALLRRRPDLWLLALDRIAARTGCALRPEKSFTTIAVPMHRPTVVYLDPPPVESSARRVGLATLVVIALSFGLALFYRALRTGRILWIG